MDWLRETVTDIARPFRDSDVEVRRRWYPVPRGTPTLGYPTAFGSARWEAYPWRPRDVGEVYPPAVEFTRTPTPSDMPYTHVCGTEEEFQRGAIYNADLPPVQYDQDWIPTCCGRPTMCLCEPQKAVALGNDQANAFAITGSIIEWASTAATRGLRLPKRSGAVVYLLTRGFASDSCLLYPPVGDRLQGEAADVPIVLTPDPVNLGMLIAIRLPGDTSEEGPARWRIRRAMEVVEAPYQINATLAPSFTITAASGVWQDTGFILTTPTAGIWTINGQIRGELQPAAAGVHFIRARLVRRASGVTISNETMVILVSQNGVFANATAPFSYMINAAAGEEFELQVSRTGGPWTASAIQSDTNGFTWIGMTRVEQVP